MFVPFFGRLACTRSGPPRIAMHTGAPVLPVFVEREAGSARHRVRIHPALEILPAGDDREAAIRENARRMTQVDRRGDSPGARPLDLGPPALANPAEGRAEALPLAATALAPLPHPLREAATTQSFPAALAS